VALRTLETRLGTYRLPHFDLWQRRDDPPGEGRGVLARGARVLAMGSCFARDAVGYLSRRGYRSSRYPAGHLYNTHVIRLELEHVLEGRDWPSEIALAAEEGVVHRYRRLAAPTRAELVELDRRATERARRLISRSDVLMIVFGTTTEVWRDSDEGLPTNQIPPPPALAEGGWDVDAGALEAIRDDLITVQDLLDAHASGPQVYSVCPIPIYATWLDRHVADSNGRAKALLRTALELEMRPPSVYLPLWDWMQAQTERRSPTKRDGRHFDRRGVDRIMLFAERYLAAEPVPPLGASERVRARIEDWGERIRGRR
jgi:GSCFA family